MAFTVIVVPCGHASSYRTGEATALANIDVSIEAFEAEHQRLPHDWAELDGAWQRPLNEVFPKVLPTTRYEYFNPPLQLRLHERRTIQVLAITRKAMRDTTLERSILGYSTGVKGPGRYVIRREEGDCFVEWLDEAVVQTTWASTGRALPLPDQEPERNCAATRLKVVLGWILRIFVVGVLLLWITVSIKKRARGSVTA